MTPTDDGTINYGKNLPYGKEEKKLSPMGSLDRYPIGLFPPNPLGLFDMSGNGLEWVKDWYAADAYSQAPSHDPQGPTTGTQKVTRSWGGATSQLASQYGEEKKSQSPCGRQRAS